MNCSAGNHPLTVPYHCIERFAHVGPMIDSEHAERYEMYERWETMNEDGGPKEDGIYLCDACFFEMMEVLERWRQGTSNVDAGGRP
jgi:hypothetical protein